MNNTPQEVLSHRAEGGCITVKTDTSDPALLYRSGDPGISLLGCAGAHILFTYCMGCRALPAGGMGVSPILLSFLAPPLPCKGRGGWGGEGFPFLHNSIKPLWAAAASASVRLETPSFFMMR